MQKWWDELRAAGAVWQHSRDPRAPHVVLRSGRHSDGFIDTLQYLSAVRNLEAAAHALERELNFELRAGTVDWVFGSPMAGVPIATVVALQLRADHIAFTEKTGKDGKELVCRFDVPAGESVLCVEEMSTTGQTPQRSIDAIRARNPRARILPYVGAFLIRCANDPPELKDAKFVPVVSLPMLDIAFNEWPAEFCPLCRVGSRAIENCKRVWKDLLRTMEDPTHLVP
ncbi:MAG TPA: hypothetical protein VMC43_00560 [Candidatus Paceibacterota bacterium]|nr:hypothetical protein [Candidatus Paceibacterota bacterium]